MAPQAPPPSVHVSSPSMDPLVQLTPDGDLLGLTLGDAVGPPVGLFDGDTDGIALGARTGLIDGETLGLAEGEPLGEWLGLFDGCLVEHWPSTVPAAEQPLVASTQLRAPEQSSSTQHL